MVNWKQGPAWGAVREILAMTRKQWVILGVILVVLTAAGIVGFRRQTGLPVQVAVVAREDLQAKVTANGKVQAQKKVDISANHRPDHPPAVEEGDRVKKGHPAPEIDPNQSRAAAQPGRPTCRRCSTTSTRPRRSASRPEGLRAGGQPPAHHRRRRSRQARPPWTWTRPPPQRARSASTRRAPTSKAPPTCCQDHDPLADRRRGDRRTSRRARWR